MASEQRPVCPICMFPLDAGQTVKVRVPVGWTDTQSNVAYICSNCETCCLAEETVNDNNDLPSLDQTTKSKCHCSGESEVEFKVELKKLKSHKNCGALKLKCSRCGALKKFLSEGDDVEEDLEVAKTAAAVASSKEKKPAQLGETTKYGYIGFQSKVEGAYNYPTDKPNLIPEIIPNESQPELSYPAFQGMPPNSEMGYPSPPYPTSQEMGYPIPPYPTSQELPPAPVMGYPCPGVDAADGNMDSPEVASTVAVHNAWLKSLEDAKNNPAACPYCNDPSKQQSYFNEGGFVTHVLCRECGARTNWTVGDGKTTPKTLVTNLDILRPADHVAWHRPCGIWHHAIIFDVDLKYQEVEVIHYNGGLERVDDSFASIRRQWIPVDVADADMYRIDYKTSECHSPELVMSRACQRLHESEYNPFTHNCEHFARWCKTGHERSVQIERIPIRMQKAADKITNKITSHSWFRSMSESETVNSLNQAGDSFSKQTMTLSNNITSRFNSLSTSIKSMFGRGGK